ncbi:MAG TPA: hypothetical protein VIC33_05235 [Vicinamibacterales bacterium]|jgi:hypothetical protein
MRFKAAVLIGALTAATLLPSAAFARGQAQQAASPPPVPVAPPQTLVATEHAESQAARSSGWLQHSLIFESSSRRSLDLGTVTVLKLPHSAIRMHLRLGGFPTVPAPPNLPWQEQALFTVHAGISVTHGAGAPKSRQ